MNKLFFSKGKPVVTSVLVAAGLIVSVLLSSGCKKTQNAGTASSSSPRPSASGEVINDSATIPEEALQKVRMGIEHVRSHDYDKAIKEFSAAIEKHPKYEMAYNDRAAAYMRLNKFDEAKDDLTKALLINPRNPVTYYNFASLHAIQKQSGLALDYLDKALETGFKDYDFLRADPDLNNIRKNPEFRKILERHGVFVAAQ